MNTPQRFVTVTDKTWTAFAAGGGEYKTITRVGYARFHAFGTDYQEFENGPGNYPVAIIEWPDGQVETVCASSIKFVS